MDVTTNSHEAHTSLQVAVDMRIVEATRPVNMEDGGPIASLHQKDEQRSAFCLA